MKKIFIIHGWGGTPKSDWYNWLKKELEKKGYQAEVPEMPDTMNPKIDAWVSKVEEKVGKPDENTYFVGHSIGCQTILRYLEKLPEDAKLGGAIFVAGWFDLKEETWDEDYTKEKARPWIETPIDFEKIKKHTNKIVAIFSDNDPYVALKNKDVFSQRLGAQIIIEKSKGHFSGEEGVKELPIVLDMLLKWLS